MAKPARRLLWRLLKQRGLFRREVDVAVLLDRGRFGKRQRRIPDIGSGCGHHDSRYSAPAMQAAMVVFSVHQSTVLTMHFVLSCDSFAGALFHSPSVSETIAEIAPSCHATYAVLRWRIEDLSAIIPYFSE